MTIMAESEHPFIGRFLPMVKWQEARLSSGIVARFRVYQDSSRYVLQCTIPGVCSVAIKEPFDSAHEAMEKRFEVLRSLGYEVAA